MGFLLTWTEKDIILIEHIAKDCDGKPGIWLVSESCRLVRDKRMRNTSLLPELSGESKKALRVIATGRPRYHGLGCAAAE